MDRFVADPHWHGLIVAYFFLGGIAAGAYALASLAELFGDESDRRAARAAHYLALPLVAACGVLLVVDLGRPERFWHMLIQSETGRPMFKWWSPMSVGSWGLTAFGAFAGASFVGVLVEDGRLGRREWSERVARWRRSWAGKAFAVAGGASAFFLGSYTGALLSATNQPVWANTTWLAPLFLASSASTGIAAIVLLAPRLRPGIDRGALARLEWADGWAIALELGMLVAMVLSLGPARLALTLWPGILVPLVVVPVGLLLPLVLRRFGGERAVGPSAVVVLAGGLVLRAAVVGAPASILLATG